LVLPAKCSQESGTGGTEEFTIQERLPEVPRLLQQIPTAVHSF